MNRITCRAIIIKDNSIAVMHRIKDKREYYTFAGGGLEKNETLEECVIREVKEEFGIDIEVIKLMYRNTWQNNDQYFYLCNWVSGTFGTGIGEEFTNVNDNDLFEPMLIKLDKLTEINLLPEEITEKLKKDIEKIV